MGKELQKTLETYVVQHLTKRYGVPGKTVIGTDWFYT